MNHILHFFLSFQSTPTIVNVNHGEQYLLRLVNANAYNCPVLLSVSGHDFRVSAVDGNSVEPEMARRIVSFPGTYTYRRFPLLVPHDVAHSTHVRYDRCTCKSNARVSTRNALHEILYVDPRLSRSFVRAIALKRCTSRVKATGGG